MFDRRRIAATLLAFGLVAAACGEDRGAQDDTGDDGTGSTSSTIPTDQDDDGDTAVDKPAGDDTPAGDEVVTAPGFVDERTFRARQDDYLAHATEELNPSSALNVLAHVTKARREGAEVDLSSVTPEALAGPLDDIRGWRDTSDFDALYLLNLLYAGADALPAETVAAVTDALLGFEYWYTEPTPADVVDDKYYWSENHRIIFHTVELLAGNRWPDETFRNDGRTGAEHATEARERILTWMEEKARFGFTEWHSDVYYQKDITPLLTLVEWSGDPELETRAAMLLDLWLFDLALHLHDGNFGATHGRSYMKDKSIATQQDTFGLAKLLFDDTVLGWTSRGDAGATLFARAERYRPPAVLERVAHSTDTFIDRERMGVPLDPSAPFPGDAGAPYGYSFDDQANVDFWWERGAQTAWQAVPITLDALDRYGLWSSQFFSPFQPLANLFGGDRAALQDFVAPLAPQLAFGLLPEVSTTTYRTKDVMLSTALDHRPGAFGDQQHISQATLSEAAVVFVTHPKNEPFTDIDRFPDADGYWTGSGTLPRSAQVGATSVHLYTPAYDAPAQGGTGPLDQFTYLPLTHAYFPTEHFDEVTGEGNWVFGRKGDGYVGVWSWRPADFVDPVPADIFTNGLTRPFDLRAEGGPDNVWIVEVGDGEQWGDFDTFRTAMAVAEVTVTVREVDSDTGFGGSDTAGVDTAGFDIAGFDIVWHSPAEGRLEFSTDGPLLVNGTELPLRHELRFDNPWATVPFDHPVYEIGDGEGGIVLDFDAGTRTVE